MLITAKSNALIFTLKPNKTPQGVAGSPQTITKGEKKMTEMFKHKTSFPLRDGFSLWLEDLGQPDCSNGNYPGYEIRNSEGRVVQSGLTCRCGRGCANTDCIRDDWGDHDTDIEKFRR